jgi:Uri superfamily endonuclease
LEDLPCSAGTYILTLKARQATRIQVGHLGVLDIQPGWYLYVGSAFGPGGLRGRLKHHLHSTASPRWHVDYLRREIPIQAVWYCAGARLEHAWARELCTGAGSSIPLLRFGSSDCQCPAHLVYMPDLSSLNACQTFRAADVIRIGLQ